MARYKSYSYEQSMFIPINFNKQIISGTFEYALSYIVDKELDLSVFESRYKNDETGAPAYDPAIMLKIVLYAYSRGITSYREIEKLEKTIRYILDKHQSEDRNEDKQMKTDENKHIENIREKITKIKQFIKNNEDKQGPKGNIKKSNITDNESAKMPSSQGVIQGYNGVAIAEAKHQIIVHAEAFGQGPEKDLLKPLIQGAKENFKLIGEKKDIFKKAKLIADTGYFTKDNIQLMETEKIDAYIPDNKFRKRDPRFDTAQRHDKPIDRKGTIKRRKYFAVNDFRYDEQKKDLNLPRRQSDVY